MVPPGNYTSVCEMSRVAQRSGPPLSWRILISLNHPLFSQNGQANVTFTLLR